MFQFFTTEELIELVKQVVASQSKPKAPVKNVRDLQLDMRVNHPCSIKFDSFE